MKIFINYCYFTRAEASKLIRNDSNNDHWPTANSYINQLKTWLEDINKQQEVIKDYLKYLGTIKKGNEYFVIKIVNDINTKLKVCNAKSLEENYYIERIKQREKGTIGADYHDPVLEEIKNLREGLNFPEYPAIKEQLKTWYDNPDSSLQKVREIFANYPVGQWETIYDHLRIWNNSRPYPIKEINDILNEWHHNKYKVDKEFKQIEEIKSLQIQLEERKDNYIRFVWRVPITIEKDKNDQEIKNRVFPNILNYLFYLNGEYYEVSEWKQTGFETAEILAEKSIFYNGYWWLIGTAASGWIHHSPINPSDEVCNCQPYDYFDSRNDFTCDYELKFDLYRVGKDEAKKKNIIRDPELPFIGSGLPEIVRDVEREWGKISSTWKSFKEFFTGMEGILYILLAKNLNNKGFVSRNIDYKWKRVGKYNETNKISDLANESHLDFLKSKDLLDDKMYHCLTQHIKATIFWRNQPKWQGNYFVLHNESRITESVSPSGTCITIEGSGIIIAQITEFITAKVGGDNQTNSFLSSLISIGTTVAATYLSGGIAAAGKGASTAIKAGIATKKAAIQSGIGAIGSMAGTALNHSLSYSSTETKESMSIHEFKHKYLTSKTRPLSIRLEWNQQSFNQYSNNRELFGVYRNDTFNVEELGTLLNNEGYLKLIINSWRMVGTEYSQWFQSKLGDGVFLEKDYGSIMKIKLSKGKVPTSQGGIQRSSWDEVNITETVSAGSGWDDIAHMGGGFWIYKKSPRYTNIWGGKDNGVWIVGGSYDRTNLLDWLIKKVNSQFSFVGSEDNEKWIIKHPEPTFNSFKVDIPDQYKNKTIEGFKCVQIHYLLDFFSDGKKSDPGDEINATHFLVHRNTIGNKGEFVVEIKGHHILKNKVSNPEGIPPAGTLPTNPLGGMGQVPNPLGITGTLPPGGQGEIVITPPAGGGGLGEIDVNIEDETQTEPPEIQNQVQDEIQDETQNQEDINIETSTKTDDETVFE